MGRNEGERLEPRLPRGTREHVSTASGAPPCAQGVPGPAVALQGLRVLRNVESLQHLQLLRRGGKQLSAGPSQGYAPWDPWRGPTGKQMRQPKKALVGLRMLQRLGPLWHLQLLLAAQLG